MFAQIETWTTWLDRWSSSLLSHLWSWGIYAYYIYRKIWPLNTAEFGAIAPCAIENLPVTLQSTLLIHRSTPYDSVNPFIKLYKSPWISLVHFFTWVIYFMTIFSRKQGKNYSGWNLSFKKILFLMSLHKKIEMPKYFISKVWKMLK